MVPSGEEDPSPGIEALENAEKLFEVSLSEDHHPGNTTGFVTDHGLLTFADQDVFLLDLETGKKIWSLEDFSPIVADPSIEPPFILENDIVLFPLRDLDYDGEKMDTDNVPSLVKINLKNGEIIWKHPIARNTPPMQVSELTRKNDYLIAEGNFIVGDLDDKYPVYGANAGGIAIHDYHTGELINAFSASFGSIEKAEDDWAYYSKEVYSNEGESHYAVGKKHVITHDRAWETVIEEKKGGQIDVVVAINSNNGEILWKTEEDERIKSTDHPMQLFPNFLLLEPNAPNYQDKRALTVKGRGQDEYLDYSLINVGSGKVLKELELLNGEGFIVHDKVYLFSQGSSDDYMIHVLDKETGNEILNKRVTSFGEPPRYIRKELVEMTDLIPIITDEDVLKFINPESGEIEASFENVEEVVTGKDAIYVVVNETLKIIDPDSMDVMFSKSATQLCIDDPGGKDFSLHLEKGDLAVIEYEGTITVLNKKTSEQLYSFYYQELVAPIKLIGENLLLDHGSELVLIKTK